MKFFLTVFSAIVLISCSNTNTSDLSSAFSEIQEQIDEVAQEKSNTLTVLDKRILITNIFENRVNTVNLICSKTDSIDDYLQSIINNSLHETDISQEVEILNLLSQVSELIVNKYKNDFIKENDYLIEATALKFNTKKFKSLLAGSVPPNNAGAMAIKAFQLKLRYAELNVINSIVHLGLHNGQIFDLMSAQIEIDEPSLKSSKAVKGVIKLTVNSSFSPLKIHFGELDKKYFFPYKGGLSPLRVPLETGKNHKDYMKESTFDISVDKSGSIEINNLTDGTHILEGVIEAANSTGRYYFPFQKKLIVD
jgi:hypothetical protein